MLGLGLFGRPLPRLDGERVSLRFPNSRDYSEWSALRLGSRGFLERWEPRWASDEHERPAWRQRMRRYREELAHGTAVPFLIFLNATGEMVGGISIGSIRRGVAQTGQIGYWMGENHAGRGYMLEAVKLLVAYGFDELKLHRIEAACIPGNERSMRVLEKAGFTREGLLRSYLKINGTWQDHYLYALVEGEYHQRRNRGKTIGA